MMIVHELTFMEAFSCVTIIQHQEADIMSVLGHKIIIVIPVFINLLITVSELKLMLLGLRLSRSHIASTTFKDSLSKDSLQMDS